MCNNRHLCISNQISVDFRLLLMRECFREIGGEPAARFYICRKQDRLLIHVSSHYVFTVTGGIMKGSCVCGIITYEITPPFKIFQYCYCSRCRKFTGSAQASNLFVPPSHFQWLQGQEHVGRFEHRYMVRAAKN